MDIQCLMFFVLSAVTIISALSVVIMKNPVYCALCLVTTMAAIAGLFFLQGAYFIAGVQLMVYAGAVMVLFVMVLMLFNLRQEFKSFSSGFVGMILKVGVGGLFLGLMAAPLLTQPIESKVSSSEQVLQTKDIALQLFTKYMVSFQFIGILLLVVLVGAIAIARSKGGTHAAE